MGAQPIMREDLFGEVTVRLFRPGDEADFRRLNEPGLPGILASNRKTKRRLRIRNTKSLNRADRYFWLSSTAWR